MGEDNKNLKQLYIIDGSTGKEIPVQPVKAIEFCEKEGEFEENFEDWYQAEMSGSIDIEMDTKDFKDNFSELIKFKKAIEKLEKCRDINDIIKHIYTELGVLPITKKRARKLLMSQGYDRNSANHIISGMRHRNMKNLFEYFYL